MKLVYWLLLVILIIIFGSNYTSAKFALKYSSPLVFALLRAALGSAFSFPFSMYMIRKMGKSGNNQLIRKNSLPLDRKTLLFVILFGITSSTFFFGFWYAGEVYTSASISSVLVNASPLFTVILAYLFLKSGVTRIQIVGLALGFAGVFLVASNGALSSFYGGGQGFILLLLSAASYAGSLIIYRRFLQSLEMITLNMLQLFFAALGLLLWILISNPRSLESVDFTSTFVAALLYTAIFGSVVANLIIMAIVRQKGPTWFSMWLFLSPVSGVVISSLVIGETLLPVQIIGMLLVVFSTFQINRSFAKNQPNTADLIRPK